MFSISPQQHPRYYHHLNIPTVPNAPKPSPPVTSRNDPWNHKATTYAWLVEQELAAMSKKTEETRRWVVQQQIHFGLLRPERPTAGAGERRDSRKRRWDGRDAGAEQDAEAARCAEQLRDAQRHAQRHEDRNRLLQEEFERMEAKWRERNERVHKRVRDERRWIEEQRGRAEKTERLRVAEAWNAYERRWAATMNSTGLLSFKTIPWPVATPPRDAGAITPDAIAKFILSPAHSAGVQRKDRIKTALRRWHPDRFGRLLGRVDVRERIAVERGVGIVARCLNELMARENR
ncbi:hypothetical protein FA95DRAFT_1485917 [Auriscalpium vulgare]|uniref:Uncharacterized protein n=1 Tax=Auriscalpium vulgare TaxID=40419 RepID=A0ACB8S5N5_9AGAM|nr:hypothetical protein FA95DRAFT_1485917 [Auriscalpium vulgare]